MLRIKDFSVPFDDETPLAQLAAQRLGVRAEEIVSVAIVRKAVDARRYHGAPLLFVYVLDVAVRQERAVLARLRRDRKVERRQPQPRPPVLERPLGKGERRPVGGRAIHQTHTRRRKHRKPFAGARCTHRAAKKREPCAANLPSLPQGAHPAARPRRKQAHAKQIIAQKQGNVEKKANFAAKLRSVCAENHKRAVKVYKRDRCQKENQE